MLLLEMFVVGVTGNLTLDLWQQIFRLLFNMPITNWAMIARWIGNMRSGRIAWRDIAHAPPVANETAWGWVAHYLIGPGLGALYVLVVRDVFAQPLTFVSALLFGVLSVSLTWFVVEPLLGAGIAASKTPHPTAVRAQDFSSHVAFGIGLYLGALLAAML